MKKTNIITILMFLLMISIASATTYYVSPTGDDTKAGTEAEPWASLSCHLGSYISCDGGGGDELSTNDVVIIKDGTYEEVPNALNSLYFDTGIRGITIQAENEGMVEMSCPTCTSYLFYLDSLVTIDGLNLSGLIRSQPRASVTGQGNTIKNVIMKDSIRSILFTNGRDTETIKHIHTVKNVTFVNVTTPFLYTQNASNILIDNITIENGTHLFTPLSCSFSDEFGSNMTIQNSNIFLKSTMLNLKPDYLVAAIDCSEDYDLINFTNNNISGRISVQKNYDYIEENNNINMTLGYSFYKDYEGYEWGNINLQNGDFTISDFYETHHSRPSFIEFLDVDNLVLTNITLGTRTNKIQYAGNNEDTHVDLLMFLYENNNVTLKDSSIHVETINGIAQHSVSGAVGLFLHNINISDNVFSVNTSQTGYLLSNTNDSIITDNIFYADNYNDTNSYLAGFGVESDYAERYNNVFSDNVLLLTSNESDNDWHIHTVLIGGQNNCTFENNTITGGSYSVVYKSSSNGNVNDNIFYGMENQRVLILIKGGENITVRDNILTPGVNQQYAIGLTTSTNVAPYFTYLKNVTLINNTITNNNSDDTIRVYAGYTNTENSTMYIYDTDAEDTFINVIGDDNYVNLWSYQTLNVEANNNIDTVLKNSSNDELYSASGSFSQTLLSMYHINNDTSDFLNYSVFGTYRDVTEQEEFILDGGKIITFSLSDFPSLSQYNSQGVKTTVFASFGLIALFLIVGAGYALLKTFETGNIDILSSLIVGGIMLGIVLLAGFIIISAVAANII